MNQICDLKFCRTKEELFALINNHIQAVNAIYGDTKFGDVTGIQFVVQRTKVRNCQ